MMKKPVNCPTTTPNWPIRILLLSLAVQGECILRYGLDDW